MSELVVEQLLKLAPQLGFAVIFIIALALLLREYGKLRSEISGAVDDAVNSRLGAILGNLQIESGKASKILANIEEKYEKAQVTLDEYEERLAEKEAVVNSSLMSIEEKLALVSTIVPPENSAKYSAQHYALLARNAQSLGEAVSLIEEARKDTDATSKDLEVVGDTARRFRRFSLAASLYKDALACDPTNHSARLELLSLTAETMPAERDKALSEIRELVLETQNASLLGRAANTYYQLDRYAELQSICREMLNRNPRPGSDIWLQSNRDLAVTLKNQGHLDESVERFEIALEQRPNDENLLKAYIGVLRDMKVFDRTIPLAKRLLALDPLDGHYYYIVGNACSDTNQHAEAVAWFTRAVELLPEGPAKELALRERKKSEIRDELNLQLA